MSFYGGVFVVIWVLKIFCPNRQAFINIFGTEVIACMVITGKERSDIWPEISNQSTGTENTILRTWSKETIKQKKIKPQQ